MHPTILLAGLFFLMGGLWSRAEEKAVPPPLAPFRYTQGFEEGPNPFQYWTTKPDKYTVNFMDLTEEQAASGRKSFKLDITFPEPGYSYWRIPVMIPVERKLAFRGKILFLSGNGARAGLGYEALYPRSYLSGCSPFTLFEPSETWQTVSGDLGETAQLPGGIQKLVWKLAASHVGSYIDAIGVFISVTRGARVVLYVDDLEIAGEARKEYVDDLETAGKIPKDNDYENEIDRRWALYQGGPFQKVMTDFESRLSGIKENVGNLAAQDKKARDGITEKTSQAAARLAEIREKGWLSPEEHDSMDRLLFDAAEMIQATKVADLFK